MADVNAQVLGTTPSLGLFLHKSRGELTNEQRAMEQIFGLFLHSQVNAVREALGDCRISAFDLTYLVVRKDIYGPAEPVLFLVPSTEIETALLRFIRAMNDAIKNTADIESDAKAEARKVADEFMARFNKSEYELEPVKEEVGQEWIALQERIQGMDRQELNREFLTAVKYFVRCTDVGNGGRVVVGWQYQKADR